MSADVGGTHPGVVPNEPTRRPSSSSRATLLLPPNGGSGRPQHGTRWCKLSLGEWEELQAKRRSVGGSAGQAGAALVSLQFIADQVVSTSHSLACFALLAARIVWLRKQRRRRGGEPTTRRVPAAK